MVRRNRQEMRTTRDYTPLTGRGNSSLHLPRMWLRIAVRKEEVLRLVRAPERRAIDNALVAGEPLRNIAKRVSISARRVASPQKPQVPGNYEGR